MKHRLGTHGIAISSLVVLLGAAGCGGGSGSIALEDLAEQYERMICEAQVACGLFPDLQTCLDASYTAEGTNIPQLESGVESGRADYDAGKASDCINLFADALASCEPFAVPDDSAMEETCDLVFTGNIEVGGECWASEECAGDADCEFDCGSNECCAGVCVAVEPTPDPVAIGEDCSEAPCVAGAYCWEGETSECVALGNEGDPCQGFGAGPCVDGLYCDDLFEIGNCVRPAAQGETCDPTQGYGLLACARPDNWCDASDTTCKKRPVVDEDCNLEVDNCIDYAYCGTDGKCVQRPGEGEACGGAQEIRCLGDLDCTDSACVAPDPDPICGPPA